MVAHAPDENMRVHLYVRAPGGIVVVESCPSLEDFEVFVHGALRGLRQRHGLPGPKRMDGCPMHAAFDNGERAEAFAVS